MTNSWIEGSTASAGSYSKEDDHLEAITTGGGDSERTWVTNDDIDLTGFVKVVVDWEHNNNGDSPRIIASTDREGYFLSYDEIASIPSFSGRQVDELDISDLNEDYYIRFHLLGPGGSLKIYKIWLEDSSENKTYLYNEGEEFPPPPPTKYAGDKIVGTSSATKPTNVKDGATFYETDTKKVFIKVSGSWVEIDYANTLRVTTEASSATPTINTDNCDAHSITALATDITSMTTNLSGTPTDFQKLIIRIKDDGTEREIAWGDSFEANGVDLPTTTTDSKLLTVGFIYNGSKWGCVAVSNEE